jgi:acetolactate synthase regulatory subunit
MKRFALTTVASVAALLLLAGCSSSSGASSPSEGSRPASPQQDKSSGIAEDGAVQAEADAQIITTGWVSISVSEPVEASAEAVKVVEARGGHIDNRSEQAGTGSQSASAQLTIRVPEDEVTETLDELKKLGTVESVSITSTDVTAQTTDLDARITAMQGSVDRLLDLMAAATDIDDLIALESAISTRQADLDSLKSQRDLLGDQVAFSTIDLQLFAEGAVPAGGPKDFWSGLAVGWNSLVAALTGSLVAFGIALPWLLVLAVLAVVTVVIIRVASRRPVKSTPVSKAPAPTP